jgi:Tfx family DNA-binding protein
MGSTESTTLTDRQVEVLEHREEGRTQQEVADLLGTTGSNVSAVERAAKRNVEKARRTLELFRTIRSPVRFTVEAGCSFDDLVDRVYREGDAAGIAVDYCRPELYSHLFGQLDGQTRRNQLLVPVEVGLSRAGDVVLFPSSEGDETEPLSTDV